MEMVIFGKNVSWEGKNFPGYFTRLTNKNTGEVETFTVKFRQSCKSPELDDCPCIIDVPREKMNLKQEPIRDENGDLVVDDSGDVKISRTIWVAGWSYLGPYIDHSLDDYE